DPFAAPRWIAVAEVVESGRCFPRTLCYLFLGKKNGEQSPPF
ncbi:MAG: hypothetical protein ACI9GW_001376, partial [Halieaceae bacterium]